VNGLRVVREGLQERRCGGGEWIATREAGNERNTETGTDGERAGVFAIRRELTTSVAKSQGGSGKVTSGE